MSGWVLHIHLQDGTTQVEEYDTDELGTLDDRLTGLFITDLEGVDSFSVARKLPGRS